MVNYLRVYKYFKWEEENRVVMHDFDTAVPRTVDTTKLSQTTIYRVWEEAGKGWGSHFLSQVVEIDPDVLQILMNPISVFWDAREETRTVEKVLREMKENMEFGVL